MYHRSIFQQQEQTPRFLKGRSAPQQFLPDTPLPTQAQASEEEEEDENDSFIATEEGVPAVPAAL